jgi:hypothetical protein
MNTNATGIQLQSALQLLILMLKLDQPFKQKDMDGELIYGVIQPGAQKEL